MSAKEDIFESMGSVSQSFTPASRTWNADSRYRQSSAMPRILDAGQILDTSLPGGREHDEMLQLVQRLFLTPAPMSARKVMFCGVESKHNGQVCANAGRILAMQTGAKVCLVDANLQHAQLSKQFNLEQKGGTYGKLVSWRDQCAYVGKNLFVAGKGLLGAGEGKLTSANEIRDRVMVLASSFDYLLFDAPGIHTSPDAALLGQVVGAAVLVLEAGSTAKTEAKKAKERLEIVNVQILGAVLNS
jgi:Mrp family chromosome partitioning ATPase